MTAQKRNENLQNVPISITAVTAAAAKAEGIESTLDLPTITPGLTVTKTGNAPLLFLRGVGTAIGGTGDEGSVNVVVDDVVYTNLPGSLFSLNNIERIEVLRGPQGTLFGRNAAGGVVNVVTRDPQYQPAMDVSVGYGNYQTFNSSAYLTGGINDLLAADLAVQYSNQADGYGRNLFNGSDANLAHDFSIRSKILWNVNDDTTIKMIGDYTSSSDDTGLARRILPGTVGAAGAAAPGQSSAGGFYDIDTNDLPHNYLRSSGESIKIQHSFSWAELASISAYRTSQSAFNFDQDGSPLPLVNADFIKDDRQFTQEFRLSSVAASTVHWIGGLFYLDANAKDNPFTLSGLALGPVGFDERLGSIDTKSYAAYAQATGPVTGSTNVTVGLRYTKDKRDFDFHDISGLGVPLLQPQGEQSNSFDRVTWRAAIDQAVATDVMLFASVSTGFKAGQFNSLNPANPPIQPEILTAYEAGVKSELFDRHLRLNASGFYYDYKNIQVSQFVLGQTLYLNAPGKIYGVDADFDWRPIAGLSLNGGAELLHARYGNFPGAPGSLPLPATCTPNGPVALAGAPTGGNLVCAFNANGLQMVRAPDAAASLTAAYQVPTAVGSLGASLTYAYTATFPWEIDNRLRQPVTNIVNGQLSWTAKDTHLGARFWVRNLTNQQYYIQQSSSLGDTGSAAAPRTYGVSVEMHY